MKSETRKKFLEYAAIAAFLAIALYFINQTFNQQIDVLFYAINIIVLPFSIALFISYLLNPLHQFIEKRMKLKKRVLSVALVLLITLMALVVIGYFIGSFIYDQALLFIERDWSVIVDFIETNLLDNPRLIDIYNQIKNYVQLENSGPISINILNVFKSTTTVAMTIVLVPVFLFFLLYNKQKIFEGILHAFPEKFQTHIKTLGKRSDEVITKYFNGRFLSMLIMSVFYTGFFFLLGFREKSVFFGFLLGFLDIIPYLGPFVGTLLPFLYSFTIQDQMLFGEFSWLAVLIVNLVGQLLQGNVLQPYIMGKEVDMHPLLVLVSFIFFGALFGITGVILAIPITGIVRTTHRYFKKLEEGDGGIPSKPSDKNKNESEAQTT